MVTEVTHAGTSERNLVLKEATVTSFLREVSTDLVEVDPDADSAERVRPHNHSAQNAQEHIHIAATKILTFATTHSRRVTSWFLPLPS